MGTRRLRGAIVTAPDLREQIAAILTAHPLTYSGTYCECSPAHQYAECDSDEAWGKHCAHVAREVTDLLIDLAGTGQLLASIDRIDRKAHPC